MSQTATENYMAGNDSTVDASSIYPRLIGVPAACPEE